MFVNSIMYKVSYSKNQLNLENTINPFVTDPHWPISSAYLITACS